ncbi:MAG: hypothetical protein QM500_03900 [Methylococcales bacterium]
MNKVKIFLNMAMVMAMLSIPQQGQADSEHSIFRRSNFSNEFNINTPEGINARGSAVVVSNNSGHHVKIKVNGLQAGETYVILNHWFEPISGRGIPNADDGPNDDPSCTGHFQFIGKPKKADKKGRLTIKAKVNQLAPHIWVANFATFIKVTNGGTQAPESADAFTTGGLLIPYTDIVEHEADFIDTDPLTVCE